jgi:hypothetical protein
MRAKNQPDVFFRKDLILALAEKEGLSMATAEHIVDFMVYVVKKKASDPKTHAIDLNFIGILHRKKVFLKKRIASMGKKGFFYKDGKEDKLQYYKDILDDLEDKTKDMDKKNNHNVAPILSFAIDFLNMTHQEIEEFQNSYYDEQKSY